MSQNKPQTPPLKRQRTEPVTLEGEVEIEGEALWRLLAPLPPASNSDEAEAAETEAAPAVPSETVREPVGAYVAARPESLAARSAASRAWSAAIVARADWCLLRKRSKRLLLQLENV
eukprot:4022973-Pyramimonas_sp.AAC.1